MHIRAVVTHALVLSLITLSTACRAWVYRPVERIKAANSVIHYPGTGGVILSNQRTEGKGICVAPPAQGAVTVNVAASGKAKSSGAVKLKEIEVSQSKEGEFAFSLAESLTKLYEQNEQTLFLQHSLYRLCEAYVNGLFEARPYSEWLTQEAAHTNAALIQEQELGSKLAPWNDELKAARNSLLLAEADLAALTFQAAQAADAFENLSAAALRENPPSTERLIEARRLTSEVAGRRAITQTVVDERRVVVTALAAKAARAQLAKGNQTRLEKLYDSLVTEAEDARAEEERLMSRADDRRYCEFVTYDRRGNPSKDFYPPLECRERFLRLLSRTSYLAAVEKVFQTSIELSRIDVERQRAVAELAKAEAEKAKAELAKAKADEGAKKNADIVDALHKAGVTSAMKALESCGEKCEEKKEEKKADGAGENKAAAGTGSGKAGAQ